MSRFGQICLLNYCHDKDIWAKNHCILKIYRKTNKLRKYVCAILIPTQASVSYILVTIYIIISYNEHIVSTPIA